MVWNASRTESQVNRTLAYDWRYTLAESDLPKVRGTADLAGIGVVQELAVGDLAAAAPVPRVLEQGDQGQHQQEDDDPQGKVAKIRVHRSILGACDPQDGHATRLFRSIRAHVTNVGGGLSLAK